jgi:hypothetical protein
LIWGGLLFSLLTAGQALAEKRVALVIGNSNYLKVKALPNPTRDAAAVAELLRASGFNVVETRDNLNGVDMRRVIRDFTDQTRDADVAVIYYAGHGMEVDGVNYLLPVDVALERDIDVEDEAISLDRILKVLEPARRLRLVILDACRDNPFTRTMRRTVASRSIGRGLARVEPTTSDTMIAFAAKAGSTADDGNDKHSPFTTALLKNLAIPGLDLRIAFGRIRDDVLALTSRRQEPFVYGSLGGTTVSLMPPAPVEPPPAATPAVAAPAPAPVVDAEAIMRRDYEFAEQVATKTAWEAFLAAHGSGFYADLAKAQIAKINAQNAKPMVVATAPVTTPPAAPARARVQPAAPAAAPAPTAAPATTVAPAPITRTQKLSPGPRMTSLQPQTQPAPAKPNITPLEIARQTHVELARLGCYAGKPDHPWDQQSRVALEVFNHHAGTQLDAKVASIETLDVLRAKTTRVCPLQCERGYRANGTTCVKVACKRGYTAGDNGQCERNRPRTQSVPRPRSRNVDITPGPRLTRSADSQSDARRVVCGQNGCLPVRPGCRGEVRPSGQSEIAVVNCR